MIKFSWKKINDRLDWEPINVITYFYYKIPTVEIPRLFKSGINRKVMLAVRNPLPKGSCYILNIEDLLEDKHGSISDIYLYLQLASKRHIFDYNMRGITYLDIATLEEYEKVWAKYSPLVTIDTHKIYFKYEEQEKQQYG